MLETWSDYLSLFVIIFILIVSLKFFIGALFYDPKKKYAKTIDIFLDYEDFEE